MTVPETIRDIIAARVDRLAESPKRTLQVASVVGRRFGVSLVSHVRETERELVAGDLKDLHAVDFVFPSAHDPELMYSFKHALTQDVVYTSLLERRRRRFHAAAGRGLEELYAGRIDDVVEILAYHYEHSAEDEKAVDYAILAAEKAQRRWANTEALALFEGALKRLASMPDTEPNRLRRIDAVVKQAEVKFALGRHAEHVQALEEIHGLVDTVADPSRRAAWYYWAGFLHSLTGGHVDTTIAYCREAQAIAEADGLDELRAFAECCLAHVLLVAGDLRGAVAAGESALGDLRGAREHLVGVPDALGPQPGRQRARRLEARPGVLPTRARSRPGGRRPPAQGGRLVADGVDLHPARRRGSRAPLLRGGDGPFPGRLRRRDGEGGPGIRSGQGGPARARNSRAGGGGGVVRTIESEIHPVALRALAGRGPASRGKRDAAEATLEKILAASAENGYRHLEGVAERLLGAVLAPAVPSALAHLERGMEILAAMGARNDVAKALVTRAELCRTAGDVESARRWLEQAEEIFQALGTLDGHVATQAVRAALS